MLNNVIKFSFAIVGSVTGYTLTATFFSNYYPELVRQNEIVYFVLASLLFAVLFYFTANKIIYGVLRALDKLEIIIQRLTLYELLIGSIGLIVGLIVANLIIIPVSRIEIIGIPLSIIINVTFGVAGVALAIGKRNEPFFDPFKGKAPGSKNGRGSAFPKILDTSVIIDGRIADICRTGLLEGELVVPSFILEELRHIADSSDPLKRNRGRRGLDVLNIIQKELQFPMKIENYTIPEGSEVDSELLKMAERLGGRVLTIDYNLNKVASFQGVSVLNINELTNAVKPIALPGEEMTIQVVKDGKENGQGIGYLDDGTMIVVDGGRRFIGEQVIVLVTSVLQTAAGRMIFAKPKYSIERVV